MNVKTAMIVSGPSEATQVLQEEVIRLCKQRQLLYGAIPDDSIVPTEVQNIIDEMFSKEEKEMTVDQAISFVEDYDTSTQQEEVLVNEVKRLRRIAEVRCMRIDQQDKKIKERNKEIKRLFGDLEVKERDEQLLREDVTTARENEHESIKELRKNKEKLGREVRDVLESYGI